LKLVELIYKLQGIAEECGNGEVVLLDEEGFTLLAGDGGVYCNLSESPTKEVQPCASA